MFLVIDESIYLALESSNVSHTLDAQGFIADLCHVRKKGYIAVSMRKSLAIKIKGNGNLSKIEKAIFSHIAEEMTFQSNYHSNVGFKIYFYHSGYTDKTWSSSPYEIDILNYANTNTLLSRPELILEDLADNLIYKSILSWRFKTKNVPNCFSFSYELVHGGGNRISDVCNQRIDSGKFVFSICDSDKKWPNAKVGNTATTARKVFEENNLGKNFHILDVHEVENLIPHSFLLERANNEQMVAVRFIADSVSRHPSCCLFYDLKNGFKYDKIYLNEDSVSRYWRGIYDDYPETTTFIADVNNGVKPSHAVIFNKLSSMLPHVLKDVGSSDIVEVNPPVINDLWCQIGDKMLEWFISSKPIRV